MKTNRGFTLFELLISLGILTVIFGATLYFLNPAKQLAVSRNDRREADLNTIINAIGQNAADNRGVFTCLAGTPSASSTRMAMGADNYNIAPCLVPAYLSRMPYDPVESGAHFVSVSDYDTVYAIARNPATGRITVSAIYPELDEIIAVTR